MHVGHACGDTAGVAGARCPAIQVARAEGRATVAEGRADGGPGGAPGDSGRDGWAGLWGPRDRTGPGPATDPARDRRRARATGAARKPG